MGARSLDYGAILYAPIYQMLGVPATLRPSASPGSATVTVIDKTHCVELFDTASPSDVLVQSVRPVAAVRATELASNGITVNDLAGGTITFNGKTWTIKLHMPVPSPTGEGTGEIYLVLSD